MAARKKTAEGDSPAPKKTPAKKAPKKAVQRHLTKELGQLLAKTLLPDLRERSKTDAVREGLVAQWEAEKGARRTGDDLDAWIDRFLEQVGVAWILSCAFVRTLEDQGFLTHHRLAGEGAQDAEHLFFELFPSLGLRDYLLATFRELSHLPGGREVLGPRHNPAFRLAPSGEALRALVGFFRETGDDGQLTWRFERGPSSDGASDGARDGIGDTRFLGDLYQDVSESVRERYALLQTPVFVEEFILDLTLEPAIAEYGLEAVRIIDPTCGSGHFLLGAFRRLFDKHQAAAPGLSKKELAGRALAQVYGVDLNPFAAAIARFRLVLAYLEAAGFDKLREAPELPTNVIVADSLLHTGKGQRRFDQVEGQEGSAATWGTELFELEDPEEAERVFGHDYHAVVGNPPYITCKDAVLREVYRKDYVSAAGKYALAAPFTERFFKLAIDGGFVGLINANSFMKREFGKKLIEEVLRGVELTHVFDTSGAYIPGHGTPTVLLFGRNRKPLASTVRAVLGKRGEPSTPEDAAHGLVWSDIAGQWRNVGFDSDYVSVVDAQRATFDAHPWSLGGGGAAELKELLEARAEKRLEDVVDSIGVGGMSNADDVYLASTGHWARRGLPGELVRTLAIGEELRDWTHHATIEVYFPYDAKLALVPPSGRTLREMWPFRSTLWARATFGGGTYRTDGRTWWEWHQVTADRYRTPLSITLAFVATHNHFVLDRGGTVFNRSAPIIKLPEGATEEDHLALLAYLNSSTACFWMKQVFHDKGSGTDTGKWQAEPAKIAYEFAGTGLQQLPLPKFTDEARARLVQLAREISELASERAQLPQKLAGLASAEALDVVTAGDAALLSRIVTLQEEIDWIVYAAFGLASDEVGTAIRASGAAASLGSRPFEVRLATGGRAVGIDGQALVAGAPEGLEAAWSIAARAVEASPELGVVETADYKRRWIITPKDAGGRPVTMADRAQDWAREARETWTEAAVRELTGESRVASASLVAGRSDPTLSHIAAVISDERAPSRIVDEELAASSIPYLAALRYTEVGLEKRAKWEETWALQRREDAGEKLHIPVPPKYDAKDFRDPNYFRIRGKLDVPKERFISYPGAEKDDDKSPLYGWAGWDHLQQATALAALYHERKTEDGWPADRLVPLLAGLLELVPWLKQWHNEASDDFGGEGAGDWYERYVEGEARGLGKGVEELRAWRPEKGRGRR